MKRVFLLSVLGVVVLVVLLARLPRPTSRPVARQPLVVYCAAGLKPPVEVAALEYERSSGVPVQLQYGGSGTLLSSLRVAAKGDLFIAADLSYVHLARSNGLVAEVTTLARLTPVIAVRKGNPKSVRSIEDLKRPDLGVALANADATAVGKTTRRVLSEVGLWGDVERRVKVFKPTVNDVANDIRLGSVDAGVVWDATVKQYKELEAVRVSALDSAVDRVAVAVLTCSGAPSSALRFARYLSARDKGLIEFTRAGYQVEEGDLWAESPRVVLFSGGVNRLAIEPTIQRFEQREGVSITRVYNGCGILVAQMKAGQKPDAYLACDVSYLDPVAEWFESAINVSETDIVMLVPKGNPRRIRLIEDLGQAGLRLGVANAQQSTLGALTARLLEKAGIYDAVMANVKTQTPTADLLVNQIRTGALDAVVVYEVNTSQVRDTHEIVRLNMDGAMAVQPYAVGKTSNHKQLMERFKQALISPESRRQYETLGFRWRADRGAK